MQRSLDKVPEIRESLEMSQHGTGRDGQMRSSQQKLPAMRTSNENPIIEDPEITSPIIEKARNTAGQGGTDEDDDDDDEYEEIDDEADGDGDEYDPEDYEYYYEQDEASRSRD